MSVFLHRMGVLSSSRFLPNKISNLALWLDAADSKTLFDATSGGSLVAADGQVARWEDKSGNGRHVTQGTSAARPIRKVNSRNGLDTLDFTSFKYLSNVTSGEIDVKTVFLVIDYNRSLGVSGIPFGVARGESGNSDYIGRPGGDVNSFYFRIGTGEYPILSITGSPPSGFLLASLVSDGDTYGFFNGNSPLVTMLSHAGNLQIPYDRFFIGTRRQINDFFNRNIAEIVIYTRALTPTERRQVEEYLQEKWATPALPEI